MSSDLALPEVYAELLGPNPVLKAGTITFVAVPPGLNVEKFKTHFIAAINELNDLTNGDKQLFVVDFDTAVQKDTAIQNLRDLKIMATHEDLAVVMIIPVSGFNFQTTSCDAYYRYQSVAHEADLELCVLSYSAANTFSQKPYWEVTRGKHRSPVPSPFGMIRIYGRPKEITSISGDTISVHGDGKMDVVHQTRDPHNEEWDTTKVEKNQYVFDHKVEELLKLVSEVSEIDLNRLKEMRAKELTPTFEETAVLARALFGLDMKDLLVLSGIRGDGDLTNVP